jgi:hypothetical protein
MGDPTTGETLEHCHECNQLTWHLYNTCQHCEEEDGTREDTRTGE